MQLVSSLNGVAVEVLSLLTSVQRTSYDSVAALKQRHGHKHQAEAFRARFRDRVSGQGETLLQLAHELEHLVRRAFPDAPGMVTSVLVRDQFVDDLGDPQLQVCVKQKVPRCGYKILDRAADLQEGLTRALEFESFGASSGVLRRAADQGRDFRARRGSTREPGTVPGRLKDLVRV